MKKDYDSSGFPEIRLAFMQLLNRSLFYANNQFAEDLLVLMKRKTFTKADMTHLKKMGFNVIIEARDVVLPQFNKMDDD